MKWLGYGKAAIVSLAVAQVFGIFKLEATVQIVRLAVPWELSEFWLRVLLYGGVGGITSVIVVAINIWVVKRFT